MVSSGKSNGEADMANKLWSDYNSLPVEAQRQVADFIALLRQRYGGSTPRERRLPDLESEPFIGVWRDREEMRDSSAWVRRTRQQEWGEPLG